MRLEAGALVFSALLVVFGPSAPLVTHRRMKIPCGLRAAVVIVPLGGPMHRVFG